MKCVTKIILVLIILVSSAGPSFGQPAREGALREAHITTPDFTSAFTGTTIWRETIIESGTKFLRLHFSDIVDRSSEDYSVVIRNYAFKKVFTYSKKSFSAKADFWTGMIKGDTAVIEVVGAKPPMGLKFVLKEYSFQAETGKVLSVVEPDEREPVAAYRDDPNISAAAKAVSKLSFLDRGMPVSCTGFMIADDLLLTNEHCINTQELCDDALAIFGYGITSSGSLADGEEYRCLKLVAKDRRLDYALLQIDGSPGSQEKWGHLELVARDVVKGEKIYMLQHPAGEPKQISMKGCEVHTPQARGRGLDLTDFGHLCDTLQGSSGSPILDTNRHQVVGLHHLGFSSGAWSSENRAVQMKLILPVLPR
jgi:V8-like Glu-specific endopeptidase